MSNRSVISQAIVKPLMLALVTSLALLGCQPNASNADSASKNNSVSKNSIEQQADTQVATNSDLQATGQASASTSESQTSQAVSSAQIIEQPITILALGDSLTEGLGVAEKDAYPAQLEAALKQGGYVNTKVINSGLSGETSTGLVNRLDWVLKTKPDITILTIGANDAMRGIDVATIESNLRTAIERLQSEGSIVVLGGMQIYDNLGNDYVSAFSSIYPKLAKEYDVAFIPFFLKGVGGDRSLNQADAIHPTKEGYTRIVNDNILPVLTPTIESYVKQQQTATNN